MTIIHRDDALVMDLVTTNSEPPVSCLSPWSLFCMTPKDLHHGAKGNVSVSAILVPRQNSCYISSALDDSVINHLLVTSAPFFVVS